MSNATHLHFLNSPRKISANANQNTGRMGQFASTVSWPFMIVSSVAKTVKHVIVAQIPTGNSTQKILCVSASNLPTKTRQRNANHATHTKPASSVHLKLITNVKSATQKISGTNNPTPTAPAPANSTTPNSTTPAFSAKSQAATSANKPTHVSNVKHKNVSSSDQLMESANAK